MQTTHRQRFGRDRRRLLGSYCLRGAPAQSRRIVSLALLPLLLLRFHPPPRLAASSKPVMVQTTSRERTFIPHMGREGEGGYKRHRLGSWRSDQVAHACPEWVLASLLAARLSKLHQLHSPPPPLSEREEEPRDVGLAPQPQRKMGTDERMESAQKLHIRLKCCLCRKDNLDRKKVNYHLQLTWLSKKKKLHANFML